MEKKSSVFVISGPNMFRSRWNHLSEAVQMSLNIMFQS